MASPPSITSSSAPVADAHPAMMPANRVAAARVPAPAAVMAAIPATVVPAIPAAVVAALATPIALRRRGGEGRGITGDRRGRGRCGTEHGGHQAGGDQECLHRASFPWARYGPSERYGRRTALPLNVPSCCGSGSRWGRPRRNASGIEGIAWKRRKFRFAWHAATNAESGAIRRWRRWAQVSASKRCLAAGLTRSEPRAAAFAGAASVGAAGNMSACAIQ